MRRLTLLLVLMMIGLLVPATALPPSDQVKADLVCDQTAIIPGTRFWVGVRLKLEPEWHVYWINPGDAGLPTAVSWTLPPGFSAGELQYPYPTRSEMAGLVGYGYANEVVLPVEITAPADLVAGKSVTLKAEVTWLACKTTCIPGQAAVSLTLPVSAQSEPAPTADLIQTARTRVPLLSGLTGVEAGQAGGTIALRFTSPTEEPPVKAEFFPLKTEQIKDDAPQQFTSEGHTGLLTVPASAKPPDVLTGVVVVTTKSGQIVPFRVDSQLTNTLPTLAASSPAPAPAPQRSFLYYLAGAFVGGLILNLMPCVFPVLSLKVMGILEQANQSNTKPYKHGLVFTLGVLLTFWSISGLLLLLRASGEQLGWGFQLQSPRFVGAMACLFFMIGLNLFGVFEVGEDLTRLEQLTQGKTGYTESLWSGALATLVATPCSAPFMGAAVGFAVTQPPLYSFLIFTSLALGMAFPYLLLTSVPALLERLPNPGAWMETFKQLMAFPMLLTCVWLGWVLGTQAGVNGLTALLITLVGLGFASWTLGRWGWDPFSATRRTLARSACVVIGLASLAFLFSQLAHPVAPGAAATETGGLQWQAYSPELMEKLKQEGGPVFVDFTAAWCLSCQVNERVALHPAQVVEAFQNKGVTMVKADWTSRDETITRALASFGRSGVPLYVLYPGGGQEPVVLPEVITPQIVLDALAKVKKG